VNSSPRHARAGSPPEWRSGSAPTRKGTRVQTDWRGFFNGRHSRLIRLRDLRPARHQSRRYWSGARQCDHAQSLILRAFKRCGISQRNKRWT